MPEPHQSRSCRHIPAIILVIILCLITPLHAATTTTSTASTRPTVVNADLLAFLIAENAKTISKILTQQYHADETVALIPVNPERAMQADVVKERDNAWWKIRIPMKNGGTGAIEPVTVLVIRTKAGAMMWDENTAQATMYEADANGLLPKFTQEYVIQTQKPVDVLQAVAAQGDSPLARCIAYYSSPPRSIAADRDANDPNLYHITMFAPEFEGPKGQAVLDASKGYLMTKLTFFFTPQVVGQETRIELERVGPDRLWFPTSYADTTYSRKDPKSVVHSRTSRLSKIVLNEKLPPDAFSNSRLNFPEGLKVDIRTFTGHDHLRVWFKGELITEDAYMTRIIAARKNANVDAPAPPP